MISRNTERWMFAMTRYILLALLTGQMASLLRDGVQESACKNECVPERFDRHNGNNSLAVKLSPPVETQLKVSFYADSRLKLSAFRA